MGRKGENNRQLIVDAADKLFYQRGFNQTSFQDISDETGIPRGNFYYYFKTKDDILDAVVESRIAGLEVWLRQCESESTDARERLYAFIQILCSSKEDTLKSGCPIGTLSSELSKDTPALREKASRAFSVLRDWIKIQFDSLGSIQSEELAMDLLARMQGVAVIASAFQSGDFLDRSRLEIKDWIISKTTN